MINKGYAILLAPWIFYFTLILLFNVKFIEFNYIVIFPILLAIFFSLFFYFIGYQKSYQDEKFQLFLNNKSKYFEQNEPPFIRLLIILTLIGCIFNLYFDLVRTLNNDIFSNLRAQDFNLFYSLRITKSTSAELVGSNFQFISKALFSFSFFFYIYNFTKKYFLYQWIIISLSLLNCLLTGGRFYFIYFIIIFFSSRAFYQNKKLSMYFTFKYLVISFIFFFIILKSFSLRAVEGIDIIQYYKYSMGIDSIALENTNFGILNQTRDNFIALIIYLTHSFYFLSEYYESFGLKAIAYGGYTFNLIFRILNTLFNTNLSPIQDFYGIDFTIGRYATFAKHLIADFGFLGMIIFYSVCSYIFGVSSNYKNLYTSFKVIYYWLVIYFLLAPLTNIMASGYLQIMTFYLIFYSFVEIRLKKNIKNFDE